MEYETLNELLDIYPFVEKFNGKINSKLIDLIRTYNKIVKSLHIGDDYFKVYPIMLESGLLKELYVEELKSIVNLHLETGKSYEVLMSETVFSYEKRIADLKEKLLSLDMKPYYGSLAYMVERSKFVLDCARKVTNDVSQLEHIVGEMEAILKDLVSLCKGSYYFSPQYRNTCDVLNDYYKSVLDIENELFVIVSKRWKDFLSSPASHDVLSFRYLIHGFTNGSFSPYDIRKVCACLVSNDFLAIPYGEYGLILDFDVSSVDTICSNDAWSFVTSKEKFIDEAFPANSQLVSFPVSYCYGDFKNSKLLLPQDVISQSVVNNLERNANVPYVYNVCVYNEIFLNSNAKVLGVFYTDKCQNVDMVREYAASYGLPLVNLSLNELRSLNGFDLSKSK